MGNKISSFFLYFKNVGDVMALTNDQLKLLDSCPAFAGLKDWIIAVDNSVNPTVTPNDEQTELETPTENDDLEDGEAGVIHVTVTEDELHGYFPLDQATVTVTSGGETYTGTTGSDGKCTISNVPAGECVIVTTAQLHCSSEDNFTVVKGENTFTVALEKDEPQETTN